MKIVYVAVLLFSLLPLLCNAQTNSYGVTNIVTNAQDSFLINPWGLSRPIKSSLPENEWWVSDNITGYTTLYYADKSGSQSIAPLVISIPAAMGTGTGSPTGTAYNPTIGPGPKAENFAFATLDGTISNWNVGQVPTQRGSGCYECHVNAATVYVNHNSQGATYTGLTFTNNASTKKPTFYAANFTGGVEAYDAATFQQVHLSGTFSDPKIPPAYHPYGIQAFGSLVVVTFYNGASSGYVDVFDTNGNLKARLPQGDFSQPWGIALAPANFGAFSNMLLVGNTSTGWIGAYSAKTGAFQGFLEGSTGSPITIPGLWGLGFGDGNPESGPTNTLYFNAGGNYAEGTFGAITAN